MNPPSDHFDGRRFFYPGDAGSRGFLDLLRWRLTSRPARWPDRVPVTQAQVAAPPAGEGLAITWIGHSSFLVQSSAGSWLTDPVFSDRIGPVEGWGPRRVAPPALRPESLPRIDGILLSHDHYDHCDLPSLRALFRPMKGSAGWDNPPPFIATPLNYTSLLAKAVPGCRPSELDWWQTLQGPGNASVQLVPALHWCRRSLFQTNIRLWGGYILRAGGGSLYFAGDTGYDPLLFADIRRRCGPPDVALLPIGAYEPRWFMRGAHMNPEEAVRAHRDLGARRSIAMHWGTIQLTDESIDAPVRALEAARAAAGMGPGEFQALSIGESVTI